MLECVQEIRRDRFVRIVRTTIGVAQRDGVVEFVLFAFSRCEIHTGQKLWFGFLWNRSKSSRKQPRPGCVSVGRRGQQQILQGATHADMLFAQIRIERADVSLGVNVQLDCRIADLEKPGLRVMGARGQYRGADQREWIIISGAAPVFPRLVSRPLTDAENSLIQGAPYAPARDGDGYNSCAS